MKRIALGLLASALCVVNINAVEKPELKIKSGKCDTVYASTQTIVGITNPLADVTINGNQVKVYKTGAFGGNVELKPGDNQIKIVSHLKGKKSEEKFNIFSAEPKEKKASGKYVVNEKNFAQPFYVTSTHGAYLQYGNGDDRLGGSKMGYISADIPLKVIGEKDDYYKVQLSANRYAYIEKDYTSTSADTVPLAVVTGSWSIANQGKKDRVSISLPCRRAYSYHTLLSPSAIVVEIYGAMDNSNWMTQRTLDLGIIDYVYFDQVDSDVYQAVIRLKDAYQWGFEISYEGNTLNIDVRHRPQSLALKDLSIGLDAGHGGKYPGAISVTGIKEKAMNLDIVQRLKRMLENAGAKVVLTRTGDTGPSMTERKQIFREAEVDIALSIHNNSGGSALSSPGTSTYYKHLFDRPLAECLLRRVLETGLPLYGLVGNFNFSLNGPTYYPNALVECMFMSSLEEEEKLSDPEFRELFAKKIFLGIEDYLNAVKASVK